VYEAYFFRASSKRFNAAAFREEEFVIFEIPWLKEGDIIFCAGVLNPNFGATGETFGAFETIGAAPLKRDNIVTQSV
jgi:hypothetical protein